MVYVKNADNLKKYTKFMINPVTIYKGVVFVGRKSTIGPNLKRSFGRWDVAKSVVESAARELREGWDKMLGKQGP
jgi:hypothetical protein